MKNWMYLAVLIGSLNLKAQERKCLDYKTGAFNYVLENRTELIIRTDSTQIELNPITEVEAHSSIVWKSDCEYVMTYTKVLNYPKDVSYMIGQKINVKIISTNSNGYKVHATSPRIDNLLEFVKVKE